MKDKTKSITTHIDHEHEKGNIFEPKSRFDASANPKAKEGCYANAEGKSNISDHIK